MHRIGLGIVGCGEVTRIMHLPALRRLEDRFAIVAVADASQRQLDSMRSTLPSAVKACADIEQLVVLPDVEAVLIASPYGLHADHVSTAIGAGRHILVEKPLCVVAEDAERISAAAEARGVILQVGYMRRYAAAFLEARDTLADRRHEIRFARITDIVGANELIVAPTSGRLRLNRLDEAAGVRYAASLDDQIGRAIGERPASVRRAFLTLLGLGSHDTSAARELWGEPTAVLCATHHAGGTFVAASLEHREFTCQMAIGFDRLARMDACLEAYLEQEVVRVRFDTPYVRHLPTTLEALGPAADGGTVRTKAHPAWEDPFEREWVAFHESVLGGERPKTGAADAALDLALMQSIVAAMIDPHGV
jgi:predicted dehydrogenase